MRRLASVLVGAWLLATLAPSALAQPAGGAAPPAAEKLVRVTAPAVPVAAGAGTEVVITIEIEPGWHVNANPSSPDYLIPTSVEVKPGFGISAGHPSYPEAHRVKLAFDESEISVYDHAAVIRVPLSAATDAVNGRHMLRGAVRFQACNDQLCLAPARVTFDLVATVTGGVAAGAASIDTSGEAAARAADTSASAAAPPPGSGFTTSPPAGAGQGAVLDNPLARKLASGSWTAFITLFLIGLALNLTPCVYPMLGVTVSIFGARRAAPPLQVLGQALVYVLGIATMYSSLGLIAAFTGGLFGGLLQNPLVLVGIGALFIVLALSMFGLYELQLPAALLTRLGGNNATGIVGTFVSGLLVGVFAAPCIGPPVVALLAIVGSKADPVFGFTSFFTLSLGLGAPYLVLGTFSNLLQTLPRSGEWMVWVKKVFGVIMLGLGAFYALLAIAPALNAWVAPAALVVGGAYLGFVEKSANARAGFRRFKVALGALAVLGGLAIVAASARERVTFEPFSAATLEGALRSGQPVLLDFTASWCVPCHELENVTFANRDVREAARGFRRLRVDLTHFDSPESERWRGRFGITGVPTVVFFARDGREIPAARVEGFLAPRPVLARMKLATGG
jgi:thiol:disulfide interchange protein DsbD